MTTYVIRTQIFNSQEALDRIAGLILIGGERTNRNPDPFCGVWIEGIKNEQRADQILAELETEGFEPGRTEIIQIR